MIQPPWEGWWERVQDRLDPRVPGALRGGQLLQAEALPEKPLRIMSFNMQAGMAVTHYHHYLTRSWRHVFPPASAFEALRPIGHLFHHCDIVALQEVDAGSLRSGFINQLQHLAQQSGFHFTFQQINRDLGRLGQYANGLLARVQPASVEEHQLPGLRGRGVILARFGQPGREVTVLNVHLALTGTARKRQLAYIRTLIEHERHIILMGDLNCSHGELLASPLGDMHWQWTYGDLNTYPSWRPVRRLDHILVSSGLKIVHVSVPDIRLSDHRPVLMDVQLHNDD